jgi:hypothetical protein
VTPGSRLVPLLPLFLFRMALRRTTVYIRWKLTRKSREKVKSSPTWIPGFQSNWTDIQHGFWSSHHPRHIHTSLANQFFLDRENFGFEILGFHGFKVKFDTFVTNWPWYQELKLLLVLLWSCL